MWKHNQLRVCLLVFILISFVNLAWSQNDAISPYSAFGLGILSNMSCVENISQGGIGVGTRDNSAINITNPASYTAIDTTSFLFEGGIMGNYINYRSDDFNENVTSASLSHLIFGFPFTSWWKSSFGLLPFSKVGYEINYKTYNEDVGSILYTFRGNGGLSRVYWGNAFQPLKSISLGLNASYLFGTIDRIQDISFPDSNYLVNTEINNYVSVGDICLDFGIQFQKVLKKDIILVSGVTYRPNVNLSSKKNYLAQTYLGEISNGVFYRDTIDEHSEKGTILYPGGVGAGFSFARDNRWLIAADYKFDKWKDFKSFGTSDSLVNSHVLAIGGHIILDYTSSSYLKRIEYRLGARYYQSYLKLRENQLKGFGITFGLGLPLRNIAIKGSKSMVNIGVETGKRGTLNDGLIQENYTNIYLGVTIYESWFYKRRYK